MRVCFWMSDKPRERLLADAFLDGVRASGDEGFTRSLLPAVEVADCDVACMVGVKSRQLFRAHWAEGIHIVYLDKGYTRHAAKSPVKLWEFWRVAIDAHQPTSSLAIARPDDRLARLDLKLKPFGGAREKILIAGSSEKYHEFYGMHEPTKWARRLVHAIKSLTERPIVYRPKPSWSSARPVDGAAYSQFPRTIEDELAEAHALVTHGSNACFEAILAGVPVIALGPAAAAPIAERALTRIETPRIPSDEERLEWLARIAYCQFTMAEFSTGEAWRIIRPQLFGSAAHVD